MYRQKSAIEEYSTWARIFGVPTFVIAWLYAIASYGFFLGVGLGWIPAAVIAVIVGLCWPVVAIGLAGIVAILVLAWLN